MKLLVQSRVKWMVALMAVSCWVATNAAWAMPHLELQVQLNPTTRLLSAHAKLSHAQGIKQVYLSSRFRITQVWINDQEANRIDQFTHDDNVLELPHGTQSLTLRYEATLAATPTAPNAKGLNQRAGTASPEGSFVPGSALWFPHPGELFSYRTTVSLPAGQKGLVAGSLSHEKTTAEGYQATFDFKHPAETIDLMAGPYVTQDHHITVGKRQVLLRTWFYPDLTPLASDYLQDSARYIERYSKQIGDYPFDIFSIVASPTPTGYGMPSLTYIGKDVLRLPFIRSTSLGHEILHNWWGNGVYPDWNAGNWSEGLTTFMADYAYAEDQGEDKAREMRMGWLRDYAAVPPNEDFALRLFTSRHGGISSIIGYNKSAMVFLMLRDQIGYEAFERGLRLLWQRKAFQSADWKDLEQAFEDASGRVLDEFFEQWVMRSGAPEFKGQDPSYRVWRRINPNEFPAILREVFVAPKAQVWVLDPTLNQAAQSLAQQVLDHPAASIDSDTHPVLPSGNTAARMPTLVIGLHSSINTWLEQQGIRKPALPSGSAWVWAMRTKEHVPMVIVSVRDSEALLALQRGLPHYGRQHWLVFEGARAIQRGTSLP